MPAISPLNSALKIALYKVSEFIDFFFRAQTSWLELAVLQN